MRWWHWVLVVVVFYEGIAGLSEILSVASPANNPIAFAASWPTVGTAVQSAAGTTNTVSGGADLGVALLVYFFFLHMHIF